MISRGQPVSDDYAAVRIGVNRQVVAMLLDGGNGNDDDRPCFARFNEFRPSEGFPQYFFHRLSSPFPWGNLGLG
jgi:hypothetical protein